MWLSENEQYILLSIKEGDTISDTFHRLPNTYAFTRKYLVLLAEKGLVNYLPSSRTVLITLTDLGKEVLDLLLRIEMKKPMVVQQIMLPRKSIQASNIFV